MGLRPGEAGCLVFLASGGVSGGRIILLALAGLVRRRRSGPCRIVMRPTQPISALKVAAVVLRRGSVANIPTASGFTPGGYVATRFLDEVYQSATAAEVCQI